jgi:hypothetical protein
MSSGEIRQFEGWDRFSGRASGGELPPGFDWAKLTTETGVLALGDLGRLVLGGGVDMIAEAAIGGVEANPDAGSATGYTYDLLQMGARAGVALTAGLFMEPGAAPLTMTSPENLPTELTEAIKVVKDHGGRVIL